MVSALMYNILTVWTADESLHNLIQEMRQYHSLRRFDYKYVLIITWNKIGWLEAKSIKLIQSCLMILYIPLCVCK